MLEDGPIHEALQHTLPEDHVLVKWALVAEVVNDEARYLIHRSAGADAEAILVWEALGLLQSGVALAQQELLRDSGMSIADGGDEEGLPEDEPD